MSDANQYIARALTGKEKNLLREHKVLEVYEHFADHLFQPFKQAVWPRPRDKLVPEPSSLPRSKFAPDELPLVGIVDDPEVHKLGCQFSLVIPGKPILVDYTRKTVNYQVTEIVKPAEARALRLKGKGWTTERVETFVNDLIGKNERDGTPSFVAFPRYVKTRWFDWNQRALKPSRPSKDEPDAVMEDFKNDGYSFAFPFRTKKGSKPLQAKLSQVPVKCPREGNEIYFSPRDVRDPYRHLSRGMVSSRISYFQLTMSSLEGENLSLLLQIVIIPDDQGEQWRPWTLESKYALPGLSSVLANSRDSSSVDSEAQREPDTTTDRRGRSRSPRRSRSPSPPVRQRTPQGHRRSRSPPATHAASLSHRKQGIYGKRFAGNS